MSEETHRAHHMKPDAPVICKETGVSFVSIIRTEDRKVMARIPVLGAVHHVAAAGDLDGGDVDDVEVPAGAASLARLGMMSLSVEMSPSGLVAGVRRVGPEQLRLANSGHWRVTTEHKIQFDANQ